MNGRFFRTHKRYHGLLISQEHPRKPASPPASLRDKRWLPLYLVSHVQHFLGVCIERHKLVWVFNPYRHATAGFLHLVSLHPLNTHKARWVRQRNKTQVSSPVVRPMRSGPTGLHGRSASLYIYILSLGASVMSVSQSRAGRQMT